MRLLASVLGCGTLRYLIKEQLYCATNEREAVLSLRHLSPSLVSSLEDFEPDLDDE